MKTANYFPLLANHYASTKSLNIRRKHGLTGYAIYLIMFQKLAAIETRSIKLSEIEELAFELHLEQQEEELREIISKYFDIDGEDFFSQELNDSLSWYDEKYNKASLGGKKAAENMTPEQLKERSRIANEAKKKKSKLPDSITQIGNDTPNQLGDSKKNDLSLQDMLPNKRTIEQANKEEKEEKEEKETELNRTKAKSEEGSDKVSFHSSIEIQKSIDNYLLLASSFFYEENKKVVINTYTDYYNQYPSTELTITKFEQVLYFHLLQMTLSIDVKDLNNYISNHSITVQSADVQNTVKMIIEKPDIQDCYKNIIDEVNPNL